MGSGLMAKRVARIPDITYSKPVGFYTDYNGGIQMVFTALRPDYTVLLENMIIFVGQRGGQRSATLITGCESIRSPPQPREDMNGTVQLVYQLALTGTLQEKSNINSFFRATPILVRGPRHLGKSHILFQTATLIAAQKPSVVVAFFGCGSDIVDNGDVGKYHRIIRYFCEAFCEHSDVAEVFAKQWLEDMKASISPQRATNKFFLSVRKYCSSKRLVLMCFIDHSEPLLRAMGYQIIVPVYDGWMSVVLGSSDTTFHQFSSISPRFHQFVFYAPLSELDAFNVIRCNTSGYNEYLKLTESEMRRVYTEAQYHPLDIVGVLDEFKRCTMNMNTPNAKKAPMSREDMLSNALAIQKDTRSMRITQMYHWFAKKCFEHKVQGLDDARIESIKWNKSIVDTSSGIMLEFRNELRSGVLANHHFVNLRVGLSIDDQLYGPAANIHSSGIHRAKAESKAPRETTASKFQSIFQLEHSESSDSAAGTSAEQQGSSSAMICQSEEAAKTARSCFPPAARYLGYGVYFNHTIEDFLWLFKGVRNKYEIDATVRLRFFDHQFLNTGRLGGQGGIDFGGDAESSNTGSQAQALPQARSAEGSVYLPKSKTYTSASFNQFTYSGIPYECTTFSEAMDVIAKYIKNNAAMPPQFVPRKSCSPLDANRTSFKDTVVLYFPCIGYDEMWIPGNIRTRNHFPGSFMAAITRTDAYKMDGAGNTSCSTGYIVTWIASDPIFVDMYEDRTTTYDQMTTERQAENSKRTELNPFVLAPKDTINYDLTYSSIESWSAKAIRIAPELIKRTLDSIPGKEAMRSCAVHVLGLAPATRISLIKNRGFDEGGLAAMSDNAGIHAITAALKDTMYYV
ncbi:hypothetical protein IWW48_003646 [Coemansia sp. RSA 1200]|nr:hypothetical protein IWW48_003646 [Coemansia sp. RSA 1200]